MEIVPTAARVALECIGNSDALYHNVEHTLLVTLAGHDILRGRALHDKINADRLRARHHGLPFPRHRLCARPVQGGRFGRLCDRCGRPQGDLAARFLGRRADAPSCRPLEALRAAADRRPCAALDSRRIADAIEGTRFPPSEPGQECGAEASIVRAADFIGQLGDPNYLRKSNALYHEFEEVGINRQLGYDSPADIVNRYPQFYWDSVAPHIQTEIRYLNKTSSGRQWIANLYSNVFRAERDISLSGPQR